MQKWGEEADTQPASSDAQICLIPELSSNCYGKSVKITQVNAKTGVRGVHSSNLSYPVLSCNVAEN